MPIPCMGFPVPGVAFFLEVDVGNSLPSELTKELSRNRVLLAEYRKIPTGRFAVALIERDILAGEKALEEHDAAAMVTSLAALRETE